jgi:hypothetical protein
MGISLRQRIAELGWKDSFLGNGGHYVRLGIRQGHACFKPFNRLQRWLTRQTLPIEQIIPVGTRVKFLCSLKHDISGNPPFLSPSWLLVKFLSRMDGSDLTKMPLIEGSVETIGASKPFSQFPFDEYLTVTSIQRTDAVYRETDGTLWRIAHVALTTVTQIEIEATAS